MTVRLMTVRSMPVQFIPLRHIPVALVCSVLIASAAAETPAAKPEAAFATVNVVQGEAYLFRGEKLVSLGRGSKLAEKDVLFTAKNAEVLVRFNDGAALAVRPNTRTSLLNLKPPAGETPGQRSMELVRGGLRYITGLLGKRKTQVDFRTATATIGIRGTDLELEVAPPDDITAKSDGEPVQDGTLVRVNTGEVSIEAVDGSALSVKSGEIAVASEPGLSAKGEKIPGARLVKDKDKAFRRGSIDQLMK